MVKNIITLSLLIVAVILIRAVFRKKVSALLVYALWLIVLIKLCIPFSFIGIDLPDIPNTQQPNEILIPDTPVSTDTDDTASLDSSHATNENTVTMPNTGTAHINDGAESDRDKLYLDIETLIKIVFAAGGCIIFFAITISYTAFNIKLIKSRTFHSFIGKTKVYVSDAAASPCVAGIIPSIYINTLAATGDKLSLVILHEKTHIRHGDHIWALLRGLALCAYWWNPLVWAAALLSKRDSELACDESVIKKMKDEERLTYAAMIVDMIPKKARIAVGFSNGPIKERINMLMKGYTKRILPTILAIFLTLLSFGCANIEDVPKSPAVNKNINIGAPDTDHTSTNDDNDDFLYSSIEDIESSEYVKSVNKYNKLNISDTVSYEVILTIANRDITLYISAPINYMTVSYPTTIHFPEITPFHESYASLFAANGCISVTFVNFNALAMPDETEMAPVDTMMEIMNECSFIDTENMFTTASGINSYLSFIIAKEYSTRIKGIAVIDAVCDMTAQYNLNDKSAMLLNQLMGGTPEEVPTEYEKRSAVIFANEIKCPVLIMNYLQNSDFSVSQANDLKSEIEKYNGTCKVVTFDLLSSDFHTAPAEKELINFITEHKNK